MTCTTMPGVALCTSRRNVAVRMAIQTLQPTHNGAACNIYTLSHTHTKVQTRVMHIRLMAPIPTNQQAHTSLRVDTARLSFGTPASMSRQRDEFEAATTRVLHLFQVNVECRVYTIYAEPVQCGFTYRAATSPGRAPVVRGVNSRCAALSASTRARAWFCEGQRGDHTSTSCTNTFGVESKRLPMQASSGCKVRMVTVWYAAPVSGSCRTHHMLHFAPTTGIDRVSST